MRILLVTDSFFPVLDGTTTTVKALVDGLVDAGDEVRVVAPAPGLTSYRGSTVTRVHPLEPVGAQVRTVLEPFGPDLALVVSPDALGRKALKHAGRLGVPTVVVEQGALLDQTSDYWRGKVALRADRVFVTSDWMRTRVADFGVDAALWEPGVDTAAFTPALRDQWLHDSWSKRKQRSGPMVVVGYVGSLEKRNGVRRLAQLAEVPGIRPVIVGDGPQRGWLASRLRRGTFVGALGTGDLTIAVPSLDVLVHPGEHETCCHVHREAAASGVPVIAPRSGAAADVVRHLETGVLHRPGSARDFRAAVESVVADRKRAMLGRRGRELSTRTWAIAVSELRGHLLALVTAGARRDAEPVGRGR